jgi:ADP-dependent NAD(P)H-hydrate dehydratase / NAD(P)H-hydrate epimerase
MRQTPAVLTPHPLEAARLLGTTAREVQADRLRAARALSQRFRCTVVLKGSGSVVAAPEGLPAINPTGNARLATAGTGDVLAGLIGARLAAGLPAFEAACASVYQHGDIADRWPADAALTAAALAGALR